MKSIYTKLAIFAAAACCSATAFAFQSGSTGADDDLNPSVSTEVVLPPNGVLNYRSVNIPKGVTITFKKNAMNTPVFILSQTDIIISGTINLAGTNSVPTGDAGDGVLADDGQPGKGGPGGFDGGQGGFPLAIPRRKDFSPYPEAYGAAGLGPSGGAAGTARQGFGGAYEVSSAGWGGSSSTPELVPLVGGSGGGGGAGGAQHIRGTGGAGGGGAILLAATGTVRIDGAIFANGGGGIIGGAVLGDRGGPGGFGGGGAVRIVASQFSSTGSVWLNTGEGGSAGRLRIEFEVASGTQNIGGNYQVTFSKPGPLFLPSGLGLRIVRVGDLIVPASPIGSGDVTLPSTQPNPVSIQVETNQIPVGSIVKVSLTPPTGPRVDVDSQPTTGNLSSALTSVNMDIPPGASVLSASVTFTITAAAAQEMSRFAQGETIERVRLDVTLGQPSRSVAITHSGREILLTERALALLSRTLNEQ